MTATVAPVSARALKELDLCARKFALRYRAERYWPAPEPGLADPAARQARELGEAFHHLVEVYERGMETTDLLAAAPAPLKLMWGQFVISRHGRPAAAGVTRHTEVALHMDLAGLALTARLDRLETDGETWTIYDWKTGRVDPAKLLDDWQTKLYLVALAETDVLGGRPPAPEAVRLVYVEARSGKEHAVSHTAAQHARWLAELADLAPRLARPFDERADDDPRWPRDPAHCPKCPYQRLCNPPALAIAPPPTPTMPRFTLTVPEP